MLTVLHCHHRSLHGHPQHPHVVDRRTHEFSSACFSARSKTNFCCVRRNSHEQSPGVQSVLTHVPSVASHHHRLLPCSKFIYLPFCPCSLFSQGSKAPTESTCSFLSCPFHPDNSTRCTILAIKSLCLDFTRHPALNHHDPFCHFQFPISPSVSDDDDLLVVILPSTSSMA